jgi:hypothetical protein
MQSGSGIGNHAGNMSRSYRATRLWMGGAAWLNKTSSLGQRSVIISRMILGLLGSKKHTGPEVDLGRLAEAVIPPFFVQTYGLALPGTKSRTVECVSILQPGVVFKHQGFQRDRTASAVRLLVSQRVSRCS